MQRSCFPDSCKDCNLYNHQIFSVCNKLLTNVALRVSDRSLTAANFINRSFPKNKIWCLPVQYINHHANFCDWNEDVDCVFPPPPECCVLLIASVACTCTLLAAACFRKLGQQGVFRRTFFHKPRRAFQIPTRGWYWVVGERGFRELLLTVTTEL